MNALDTALSSLAEASTALEYVNRPTLKDIERSRDRAKDAHEILDASAKLLKRGIYTVAEEPPVDPPLFNTQGEPAPGAEVKEEAPPEDPAAPQPTIGMNVLRVSFEHRLLDAESAWKEQGKKLKAFKSVRKAWEARFEQDPDATAKALQEALDTPNHDLLPPQQVEAPAPIALPVPDFDNTPGFELDELFRHGPLMALRDEMKQAECENEDELADAWWLSWVANPKGTWAAANAVLSDNTLSLEVPEMEAAS